MEGENLNQGAVILFTIYGGALIGLCADGFDMLRLLPSRWANGILDIFFWLCAFFIAGEILMRANGLELRLYAVAGFVAGFALYRATLSHLVMALYRAVFSFLRRSLRFFFRMMK